MGTSVRSGTARALIVTTGRSTAFGQIAGRLAVRPTETEFERGIRRLGYLLSEVMFLLVLAVFALNVYTREPVIDSFLFSIALAVGLTPQLLPAIINVNLSKGAQRMAARGVLVRRLTAIENFGLATVILPYTPLAGVFGFAPLAPRYLVLIAAIVAGYVVSAELTKQWFYRHAGSQRVIGHEVGKE